MEVPLKFSDQNPGSLEKLLATLNIDTFSTADTQTANMFAVTGWSVSTTNLKSEATGHPASATGPNTEPQSKKRKRPGSKLKVTEENVADLWDKFVENKRPKVQNGKKDKAADVALGRSNEEPSHDDNTKPEEHQAREKPKKGKKGKKDDKAKPDANQSTTSKNQHTVENDEWNGIEEEDGVTGPTKENIGVPDKPPKSKRDKKAKTAKQEPNNTKFPETKPGDVARQKPRDEIAAKSTNQSFNASEPSASKLTALQASMREKLISARFRHLNETLYTRPSAEAFDLFKSSPDMFVEYHEGFRRQVGVWPENPVDGYIADILARGRVRPPRFDRDHRHRRPQAQEQATGNKVPLPRSRDGTCTIADLGCGDAALGAALKPQSAKLHLDVRSFDLQTNGNPLVTAADVANLPIADGSVDVAIFCLALMGTNWVDFVEEAYRVLRWKGELWVAEIKSRFAVPGGGKGGKRGVVEHSVGNRRKSNALPAAVAAKPKRSKAGAAEDAAVDEADLAIDVDGAEDKRQETDVSAFVNVLAKRGFVLRGDPSEAVDLSNKMFVKMYFVKAASPTKGKGVAAAKAREGGMAKPARKKFITDDDKDDVDESSVLKPCVYKIR